jgi:hypothetical protein
MQILPWIAAIVIVWALIGLTASIFYPTCLFDENRKMWQILGIIFLCGPVIWLFIAFFFVVNFFSHDDSTN